MKRLPPMRLSAVAVALAAVLGTGSVQAQSSPLPSVDNSPLTSSVLTTVAKLRVAADKAALVANGHSRLAFTVNVLDVAGLPVAAGTLSVTVDAGARVASEPEQAGVTTLEVPVRNGSATFYLVAPTAPGPVNLIVGSAAVQAQTVLQFLPEMRDMIGIGVVEGVISAGHLQAGSITPTRFNDAFDSELTRWSRDLGDDANIAGRTAFFLKGKIRGDALLTAAYDSDKDVRRKLAQTIDPNTFYPVYGDASTATMEARSSDRLYVRVDKDKSYVLYGDFSMTGAAPGAGSALPSGMAPTPEPVVLGRYNRTATGLRGHHEDGPVQADGFVINDTLKQVIEEYPANGTSGPYAVANNSAVQNSERIEVLVRDKNQRGQIRSTTTLVRFVDYTFEPFSGRILLNRPLASLTPSGDPQSLRISYEIDQGGPQFLTYGVNASTEVAQGVRVGGSMVSDENPLAPFQLGSVNAEVRLADELKLVFESAQTRATQYVVNGKVYSLPTGQSGELKSDELGRAQRADLLYQDKTRSARAWWTQTDAGFLNTSSGLAPSRQDTGLRGKTQVTEATALYGEYSASDDTLSNLSRSASRLGFNTEVVQGIHIDLSLRDIHDNSGFPNEAQIAANTAALGSAGTVSGGFSGTGTSATAIDPTTGAPISTLTSTGTTPTTRIGSPLSATTARLGADWQIDPQWRVDGALEASVVGQDQSRAELGAMYSLNSTDRLYTRLESQTGLAAASSLNPADRSTTLSAGLLHAATPNTTLFSEYRLVDASTDASPSTFDQMLANGLRNRHVVQDGLTANSSAEYLSVLSGNQRQAFALTGGLDWAIDPRWRAGTKLEYRRLFDASLLPGDQTQDQWLSTVNFARKLDTDWTLLVKNYYLLQHNRDDASGVAIGDTQQERMIAGFAWRPQAHNRFNALARYEYKAVSDQSQVLGDNYSAHILGLGMDYRPSREWWTNLRFAVKSSSDYTVTTPDQTFNAWLIGGRLTYDVTEKIDIGVMFSQLQQAGDVAGQYASGLEAGYQAKKNLWVSLGYNWSGFYDRDLTGSDYTRQGVYLRLRAKFDELSFLR